MGVFGNFAHEEGAQLVLRELKLVVELRPGDLIIFPSGTITHKNLPLAREEDERYSVAFFTINWNITISL